MSKTVRRSGGSQLPLDRDWGKFTRDEVISIVCNHFTRGRSAAEIVEILKTQYNVALKREDPYRLISQACLQGWLSFHAPVDTLLSDRLKESYPWLEKVVVVRAGVREDISYHVAVVLRDLMHQICKSGAGKREFHLGLTGGTALRRASQHFAGMLTAPHEDHPQKLVLHAMVGGFTYKDDIDPADANSFFSYFVGVPALKVDTSFVGLHAPGIAPRGLVRQLKQLHFIKAAYDRVDEIQVILTSAGGHWRREHSIMHDLLRKCSPGTLKALNDADVIGDIMWRPLNLDGPVDLETEMRAMTLVELSDLPRMIKAGKKVILHLGPCGNCGGPKTEVLKAILESKQQLITHLVCDARAVRSLGPGFGLPASD